MKQNSMLELFLQAAQQHTGINPNQLRSVVTVINPQNQNGYGKL